MVTTRCLPHPSDASGKGIAPSTLIAVESGRFRSISAGQRVIVAVGKRVSWYRPARRINRQSELVAEIVVIDAHVRRPRLGARLLAMSGQRLGLLEAGSVAEFGAGDQ